MAVKKKTGAKHKPARSRPQTQTKFRLILTTALRGAINMAVVATVSGTVLGGLLAVKYFGV